MVSWGLPTADSIHCCCPPVRLGSNTQEYPSTSKLTELQLHFSQTMERVISRRQCSVLKLVGCLYRVKLCLLVFGARPQPKSEYGPCETRVTTGSPGAGTALVLRGIAANQAPVVTQSRNVGSFWHRLASEGIAEETMGTWIQHKAVCLAGNLPLPPSVWYLCPTEATLFSSRKWAQRRGNRNKKIVVTKHIFKLSQSAGRLPPPSGESEHFENH